MSRIGLILAQALVQSVLRLLDRRRDLDAQRAEARRADRHEQRRHRLAALSKVGQTLRDEVASREHLDALHTDSLTPRVFSLTERVESRRPARRRSTAKGSVAYTETAR
jgi:hypothetical protein